jgi:hypothetical protein
MGAVRGMAEARVANATAAVKMERIENILYVKGMWFCWVSRK